MHAIRRFRPVVATVLSVAALPVLAHPGHEVAGFGAGLVHPFGLDHFAAMLAVGLWSVSVQSGLRALAGPLCFVLPMIAGALLGMGGFVPSGIEVMVAASLLAIAGLVALARQAAFAGGLTVVAACGLLHGLAHGSEAPGAGGFAAYVAGFVVATVALHGIGALSGLTLRRWQAPLRTVVASLLAAAGSLMLLG